MTSESSSGPEEKTRRSLTFRIVTGMILGAVLGFMLHVFLSFGVGAGFDSFVQAFLVEGVLHVGGRIFIASLKLLVVPLVFVSLVCGVAALEDITHLGRIGSKTLGLYLATTAIAISLALSATMLIRPGDGFDLTQETITYEAREAPGLAQTIIEIFPTNPIEAMARANMLQIIVFSCLLGFAMTQVGEPGQRVLRFFEDLNAVVLKLVTILMRIAPYGVFCIMAELVAVQGPEAFQRMAWYFVVVLGVLLLHAAVTYPLLLTALSRLNPLTFLRKIREPISFAFSTASSGATIPVTLEAVRNRLGVHNLVSSFTVPLGATVNMDGTAIMQGVATGFIAQAYGVDLTGADYLAVVLTATLASIGTAGVPGAGLIMLAMVLRQVNLPVEGIGLILGVDRLLDMVRTAVNITGDAAVTCIVAKSEGDFSQDVFDGP